MPFITGCRVHLYDNISFGNLSDRLCTQCVFLPLRNTCFRPGRVGRLFPSRTVVTFRKFSTVHFFAQMTNIVTSFSSCRLGFHTCELSAVYTEVKHSIRRIGLQEFAYRVVCQACCPPTSIQTVFWSLLISIHKVYSILIEHAFPDNSDLFPIARTSEESQVLGISADIRIIFPFRKHVLQQ